MENSKSKVEITSDDQILHLFRGKFRVIENFNISTVLQLNQTNYVIDDLVVMDCQFSGRLDFRGCDIKNGIRFINCVFDDKVEINNCTSNKFRYKLLSGDISIEFIKCTFKSTLNVYSSTFDGGIKFINCKAKTILFQFFEVRKNGGLEFRNDTNITNSLVVKNCTFKKGEITFYRTKINGHLRFENNVLGGYDFSFSEFLKNIFIWVGNCNSIIFYQSRFGDDFNIQVVKIKQSLSIIECEFKKVFKIELDDEGEGFQGYLNSLYLSESEFFNVFKLCRFSHSDIAVAKIDLVFTNLNGSFHFDNISVDELNISGHNKDSRLVVDEVTLQRLTMSRFRNSGSIDFIKVNPMNGESVLNINHSILGVFSFVNCRMKAFQKFVVDDSVLDQVVSSGTKWFDFKQISESYGIIRANWFKRKRNDLYYLFKREDRSHKSDKIYQIREIFRQLKAAMDKQGNRIQALFFQSQEFKAYKRELEMTERITSPERLIIWSNSSNSHGQDWIKPIGLGVMMTVVIFALMVYSMNDHLAIRLPWNSDYSDTLSIYATYIKSLPELFNPTFRMNFVFPEHVHEFTFMTFAWALIQRISISYFIFQTISAFRKYVK